MKHSRFGLSGLLVVLVLCLSIIFSHSAAAATAPTAKLPVIKILGTGGTIVNIGGTTKAYAGLSAADFAKTMPELGKYAKLEFEQIVNIPSSRMSPEVWCTLADRINEILASNEVDGVVITHGTDTMEETAYFLNLVVKSPKPVVITGSMISAKYPYSEGPSNLLSAVRLAASPQAQGMGVLLVANDRQIFAARNVRKNNTIRVDAFSGGEMGELGYLDDVGPVFYQRPMKLHTFQSEFNISKNTVLPSVYIVSSYAGADGSLVDYLTGKGAKGIVIAGTGAGGATDSIVEAAQRAIDKGITVVMSTRVTEGRVQEEDADIGIRADNLSPQKARILLMLALSRTNDAKEIQRMFNNY